MSSIFKTDSTFQFKQLSLATPTGVQGGTYYSKILINNEPVYFQAPKCLTKNGIKKTDKKTYCDLLLTNDNSEFIEWLSNVEKRVQDNNL